ncbi:FtsX-like permease family protein [Aerococcaceae bacterium DSM 111020]|nr:FtsX-like permease family protein [Aerococcaceae bacterium DSM 111020]
MKSAIWKDNFREIKDSFARFFSLLIIIMLGVSFFVGIKAAGPSMLKTADAYYQVNQLPDGQIVGTMGLTKEDLELTQSIEGVDAQGLQSVIQTLNPSTESAKFLTYDGNSKHNIYHIVEGRMVENRNEIVLDSKFIENEKLQGIFNLGDTVTVDQLSEYDPEASYEEGQTPLYFKQKEFKIVGFAQTPLYMDRNDRGIQGNSVFAVVCEDAIGGDYFSEILYWTLASQEHPAYSPAYDDAMAHYTEAIEQKLANQPKKRLEDVRKTAKDQLNQSQRELNNAEKLMKDQQNNLSESRDTLNKGWEQYYESLKELQDGYRIFQDGETDYDAGLASLQQGRQELALSRELLMAEEENFQQGWSRYVTGERAYRQQINQAYDQLIYGQEEIQQNEHALNDALNRLVEGQLALNQAKSQLPNINTQSISSIQALLDYIQENPTDTGTHPIFVQANVLHQEYRRLKTLEREIATESDALTQEQQALEQSFNELIQAYDSVATSLGLVIDTTNMSRDQVIEQYQMALTPYLQPSEETMEELESEIATLDSQMNAFQQQITELEIEREELEQAANHDTELAEILCSTQAELDTVNQQMAELDAMNTNYQAEIVSLQSQLANLDASETEDSTVNEEISRLTQTLNEMTLAQTNMVAELEVLANRKNTLMAQIEELKTQQGQLENPERLDEIALSIAELQQQYDALRNQRSKLNQTLEALKNNDISEVPDMITIDIETWQQQWEEVKTAQAELAEKQAQLDAGFESYSQGREALQQARKNLVSGQETLSENQRLALAQLNQTRALLDTGRIALDSGYQDILSGENTLNDAQRRLDQARIELDEGLNDYQQGLKALFTGYSQLEAGEREWEAGKALLEQSMGQSQYQRRKGQHQIQQGYQELQDMQEPNLIVNDRHGFSAYSSLKDNADQLNVISNFFPVIFFLVAILVAFTTIKRMVSEQRMYMGTMLQLGYPDRAIIAKFGVYAGLSSVIGVILGIVIGYWTFPPLIVNAYNNMHYLDEIHIARSHFWNLFVAIIALLTAILPAIIQPLRNLSVAPAELLLPEPPRSGKKIFLEQIPLIWNRLSFKKKMTVRNLLRYKGRNAMTLIGVAGCTMLMVTGFGISDTITHMVDVQTQEIQTFDNFVYINEDGNVDALQDALEQNPDIASVYPVYQTTVQTDFENRDQLPINVMVPLGDSASFDSFIELRMREEGAIDLEDGPVMTERLAEHYDYDGNESFDISVRNEDQEMIEVPIEGIAENYLSHYIYMTPEDFMTYFNVETLEPSLFLVENVNQSNPVQVEESIAVLDSVATVLSMTYVNQQLNSAMDSLYLITIVLLIAAAGLAFVVLYNLTNINIGERIKELSTIKVLGFYDHEVSLYIYDEIFILSVIGGAIGLVLGNILTKVLMKTMQTSDYLFHPVINWDGYLWSFALTIIFSIIVMLVMHRKLKNIDVVEAMKAVE